jgi:hypothetical protein
MKLDSCRERLLEPRFDLEQTVEKTVALAIIAMTREPRGPVDRVGGGLWF